MSYSSSLPRALSRSLRPYLRTTPYHTALLWSSWHVGVQAPRPSTLPIRSLSISSYRRNGVPAGATTQFASPTDLTPEQYHKLADQYIDDLVAELEEIQEEREEVDVEYSVSPESTPCHSVHPNGLLGGRAEPEVPTTWHVCAEQATGEQADLALIAGIRAKAVRLCRGCGVDGSKCWGHGARGRAGCTCKSGKHRKYSRPGGRGLDIPP